MGDCDADTDYCPTESPIKREQRSKQLHGDKIVVAIGKYKGYLVVVVNKKGRPKTCCLCGKCSNDPSPFDRASNEDEFGGYRPWLYTQNHHLLVREVRGQICLICFNVWRLQVHDPCSCIFIHLVQLCAPVIDFFNLYIYI